jgi:hypothetical protein
MTSILGAAGDRLHEIGPVVIQFYLKRGALSRHPCSWPLYRSRWPAAIKESSQNGDVPTGHPYFVTWRGG